MNFDVAVMIALSISAQSRKLGHRLLKFSAESRYEFLNSRTKLQPEPPGNLKLIFESSLKFIET